MRRTRVLCVVVFSAVILTAAIAVQIWSARQSALGTTKSVRLASLPTHLNRGTVRDEPVAATDEMKRAIGELLNYDTAVYRIYDLPEARISVYVAMWREGRMSPRLVAAHTPDVCWPVNGWIRDRSIEQKHRAVMKTLAVTGFSPGESRVFVAYDRPEYVVFWHKVGAEFFSYETGASPPWWAWLSEFWHHGLHLRRSQLFVRVSSNVPLESVWALPELAALRQALLDCGLSHPPGELKREL